MIKTTVYLPKAYKDALRSEAERTHESEADLIRTAVAQMLGIDQQPRPRFGQFSGAPLTVAEMDAALADGLGERCCATSQPEPIRSPTSTATSTARR